MKNYKKLYDSILYVNGLDADTGRLLTAPVRLKSIYRKISDNIIANKKKYIPAYYSTKPLQFIDAGPEEAESSGWGLLLHKKQADLALRLKPLVEHRKGKVIIYNNEEPYEYIEKNGGWDPDFGKLPYYLLLAGDLTEIPLTLQYLLDLRHSCGRISFNKPEEYALYAEKVAHYKSKPDNSMLFFATDHGASDPTYYSRKYMVEPLAGYMKREGFSIDTLYKNRATEDNLINQSQKRDYDIIFTASHGMAIKDTKARKYIQGALVCQDIVFGKDLLKENKGLLTGLDIQQGYSLNCKAAFFFACYSAGTCGKSDFALWVGDDTADDLKQYESKKDFVAHLPQRLLLDGSGPYVVMAHMDPAWIFSFMDEYQKEQRISPFKNCLVRLMKQVSAGRAVRDFNFRYASLSIALLNYVIDHMEKKEELNPLSISSIWVTRQDAQNYILLGDPAFRI